MLKKNFLIVFFASFLFASQVLTQGFNSIFTKDGSHIIAVGEGGACFMSYDSGVNFGSYPVGSQTHNSVYALSNKVFIASNNGTVSYSTDNGGSWNTSGAGSNNLNGIYFVDVNTGWVVGNGGVIFKTVNGGVNWTAQSSGVANNLRGVKFTSSSSGVACGEGGKVLYTVNGGSSWQQYSTPTTKNLLSIDQKVNTILATGEDGFIIKYNGSSWSMIDYKTVSKSEVRGVSMIDANTFYTCGGGGFINKTSDGGATRTYQMNPMMGYLKSIYFYDANNGWAVASNNKAILRTNNGGSTWQFQTQVTVSRNYVRKQNTSGNIGNPFCMHPQNKNGMFILAGSSLYRSLDKGETWTLLSSGIPGGSCHSFFVNTLDTNLMIASKGSGGGRVIGSTNYGQTWYDIFNPINLTSYGMPLEVDPNNPNTVYLAPDNAPLRKSTNWGANWTLLSGGEPGGIFRSPCDVVIQFENPNVIIIGDGTTGSGSGKVWRSSDGGLNWSLINTVSGSEIPMLANSSLDLNLFYHSTWSSGSFWKSTNMGVGFNNLSQSGSLWACDVAKDDPTAVSYDLYGTNTYLSIDAGATFTQIPATSSPAAGVLFCDKATLLFQHGSGVDKLNITYTVTPVTGNQQISGEVPKIFALGQNYPNPFNPVTLIKYDVAKYSHVSLKVYNVLGNEASVVVNANLAPGKYSADFNASGLASGVYFYSLFVDGAKVDTKKMILVK
jgi:photosystem II stability/assembly factor-like uncharacterized protein